ncbi:unnamed protein product [Closterium sp. NIES-64]|nr:unnamed protein product [Closterium sp. NIES-64]
MRHAILQGNIDKGPWYKKEHAAWAFASVPKVLISCPEFDDLVPRRWWEQQPLKGVKEGEQQQGNSSRGTAAGEQQQGNSSRGTAAGEQQQGNSSRHGTAAGEQQQVASMKEGGLGNSCT